MRRATIVNAAIAVGMVLALAGDALTADLPSNLQIMPLGDSITYGGVNGGYRGPLYNRLSATAPGFRFVGASTLNPGSLPANQQQHNGYPSYGTLNISNNLDSVDTSVYDLLKNEPYNPNGGYWLTGDHDTGRSAVYPDVIMLQIGTNDRFGSLTNYQANLNSLVNKIVTLRPDAKLIMADITPIANEAPVVIAINNTINAVAAQYRDLGKHVSVVDLYTSFPSNGLSSDGTHPSDAGYAWMADQWYDAIQSAYAVPEPGAFTVLTTSLLGLLAYVWRNRR